MFWPESDDFHARAALNQALYVLRSELGEDAILTRGEDVSLNPDAIWCDVTAFEMALDAGSLVSALSLYRGDLLDGFYVTGAPEFERWLEGERIRLRQLGADAAWKLAQSTASQGNVVEAERWARKATDFLPADEAVVRRLMTFLHGQGDRAAAIQTYETFAAMLQREYEMAPSAETSSLAMAIRLEEQHEVPVRLLAPDVAGSRRPVAERRVKPHSRAQRAYVLAVFGIMVALGAAGVRFLTASSKASVPERPVRLAVRPFQHFGSSSYKHVADGITDELSSRLTDITGLLVISPTSTLHYGADAGSLPRIGRELGAEYVLEGTVRMDRTDGESREIRVTPRLVRASDGAVIWSDRYAAAPIPGQIFRMQADIAERVANALHVTLRERERRALKVLPTENSRAYDYYLRGQQHAAAGFSELDNRLAQAMYERAVAADDAFALAHARLSQTHSLAYWFFYDRTPARTAAARRAAERALALNPDLAEAHLALGYYHYWCREAFSDALAEFRIARNLGLNSAELFKSIANVERRQGKLDEAIANFESGLLRDPRDIHVVFNLAQTYALRRSVAEAERYLDRAISLNPGSAPSYWNKARLYLNADGSTSKARAVLTAPGAPAQDSVVQYLTAWIDMVDGRYDRALQRLASAPDAIENQWHFVPRAQLQATINRRLGRPDLTHAHYDSARLLVERRISSRPDEANFHSAVAIAYAGLGRRREAIVAARRAVDLLPVTRDAWRGLYRLEDLARVYAMVGDREAALSALEHLVALPGGSSIPFLELDPAWDVMRADPRFQALVVRERRLPASIGAASSVR